jgi:hypothetical protein
MLSSDTDQNTDEGGIDKRAITANTADSSGQSDSTPTNDNTTNTTSTDARSQGHWLALLMQNPSLDPSTLPGFRAIERIPESVYSGALPSAKLAPPKKPWQQQ